MKEYLPSKQLSLTIASLLIVIIAVSFAVNTEPKAKNDNTDEPAIIAVNKKDAKIAETDSDSDGLVDWKETLWGTDPENPDSDGDGTDDNDEILANRNPTVAGPDDEILDANIAKLNDDGTIAGLSQTDILSQQLLLSIQALKQRGEFNQETVTKLASDLSNQLLNKQLPNIYSMGNVDTSLYDTRKSITQYGNELGAIVKRNAKKDTDELSIIEEAFNADNGTLVLKKLDSIILAYKKSAEEVIATKSPRSLTNDHLALANALANISISLNNIQSTFEDPVNGIMAIGQYSSEFEKMDTALKNILGFFKSRRVSFNKGEPGDVFSSVLQEQ